MRRSRAVGWLLALTAGVLACPPASEQGAPPLRVFAAASLTDVVGDLAASFGGARVEPSFGGSSALARQIRDGAPADVFVSASPDWTAYLEDAGAISGEPVLIARNRLVCVAPEGSPLAAQGVTDARALLDRLAPGDRVAVADEGVPAGEYARAGFASLGLAGAFRSRLVGLKDVRAVLHAVELGEAPAGVVYATDARLAPVEVLFAFDPTAHPPIEYEAAVVRTAPRPDAARAFVEHLRSPEARAILARAGLALP